MNITSPILQKLMHKENAIQAKKFAVDWYHGDGSALYKLVCGVYQKWTLSDIDNMIAEIGVLLPLAEGTERQKALVSVGFLDSIRHYYYPSTIGDKLKEIQAIIENETNLIVDWEQIYDVCAVDREYKERT